MKNQQNKNCSEQFREEFVTLCMQMEKIPKRGNMAKYNKLQDKMYKLVHSHIEADKEAIGEILVSLLDHENDFVRHAAACYCMKFDIQLSYALVVQKELEKSEDEWIRVSAGMYLHSYERGILEWQRNR